MAAKKKGKKPHLGRGLESLIGGASNFQQSSEQGSESSDIGFPEDPGLKSAVNTVSLDKIKANPFQPRQEWNQDDLKELTESIKANGIIQPVLLRRKGSEFEIIAGERRVRAARQAKLIEVPALVREATDEEMLELALVENIHRTDLNPLERAKAYRQYLDSFGLNQSQAAEKLGEDRSVISNHLRLLDLPKEVHNMLQDGSISMGHARAILGLPTDQLRQKMANRALAGRLSVREVEKLVRRHLTGEPVKNEPKEKSPHIADLEKKLRDALGTKVTINARKNGKRGKIIIDFFSLDEFDRLSEKMGLIDAFSE